MLEPGNGKLRPAREEKQHSAVGDGLPETIQQLQGRRVDPVRVLADDDDGVLIRMSQHHANERRIGRSFALLRCRVAGD